MGLETVTNIADLVVSNPTSGDPKSQGDDHIRNIKKALANDFAGFTGAVMVTGVDGGTANAYTLTPANPLPAYGTKMGVVFSPVAANTGASTINISGLGAVDLKTVSGAALASGDLLVGNFYVAIYTGTEARLFAPTKNYIDQLAFSAALPAQPGVLTRFLLGSSNGSATWDVPRMQTSARSSNTILGVTDSGSIIDATGTFTQTFSLPGTLGAGWNCIYKNIGTGDIEVEAPEAVAIISTTSNSISAGTVWTVPAGLAISAGDLVIVRRTSDPFNQRIVGTVASYAGTTLTVTPTYGIGSGTFTDWSISTRAATAGIDNRASYVMYPGEARLFQCNGTRIESIVLSGYSFKKAVTQYIVKPPGYDNHFARLMAAGAGGGGGGGGTSGNGSSGATGGPGGAGGASGGHGQVVEKTIMDSALGEAILFTSGAGSVGGAGGAGGAGTINGSGNGGVPGSSSGAAGSSSFGQVGDSGYLTAAGGATGVGGGNGQTSGVGGIAAVGSAATTGKNTYNAIKVCDTLAANSSTAGTSSTTATGKAGSAGANGTGALGAPTTTTTGGTAGATQVTTNVVGNAGGDATGTAAPGQGGAGGGGGGGSATSTAVSANGGAGGKGADGGPGQLEMAGM